MAVDKLQILGREWSVSWVEDLGDNYGECDQTDASIKVLDGMDSYLDRSILLHEVLHAILRQQGHFYCEEEEQYVTSLANGLVAVLDANPHFRKYLKS